MKVIEKLINEVFDKERCFKISEDKKFDEIPIKTWIEEVWAKFFSDLIYSNSCKNMN